MSLNPEEQKELVRLMKKVTFPAPKEIFDTWCEQFTASSTEIALTRKGEKGTEVFLTYRDDTFTGWHIPGSIILPGDRVTDALIRVQEKEIKAAITEPSFFAFFERLKGNGPGQSTRGQEIALVFISEAIGEIKPTETAKFFPIQDMPKDLLSVHVPVVQALRGA